MAKILVVDDSTDLAEGIRYNLELEGHRVELAEDGEGALATLQVFRPDLIILDVMLPGIDGFQVLRRVRDLGLTVPVMMLTARGEESDHIRAVRLDADQYVTKPFRLLELLERIGMMLRRASTPADAGSTTEEPVSDASAADASTTTASAATASAAELPAADDAGRALRFGDLQLDEGARRVLRRGQDVVLSPKAFDLLVALVRAGGRVLSRQELLRTVWQYQPGVMTRTVDNHVSELRHKLEDDPDAPRHILTVWKAGYRLQR
jgi:two-component system response regulator MtrA